MPRQIEFPLSVSVCAWCRPGELGASLGAVSHGICLKHLRKLRLELLGAPAVRPTRSGRGGRAPGNEALLLPLPVTA